MYEIYALKYAHHPRRASENFIGGDPARAARSWSTRASPPRSPPSGPAASSLSHRRVAVDGSERVQDLEMRYATGRHMAHECFRGAFEVE
jgi:hypothetical protein